MYREIIAYKHIIFIAIVATMFSCAIPGAPTGGPKDQIPPKLLHQHPAAQATNVQTQKLIIEFDEFVQLQNPRQNVLISPPPKTFPDVHVKKKTIEIIFKDTLQANTTYSLQFGDNIKDANESNPLSNFSWVFSTGEKLDSIEISGKAIAQGTAAIPDNTWAVLYQNLADSAFITERPYYFTKVEKTGLFKFNYLKEGTYNVFLLEDKNRNFYFDLPTEKIGFIDHSLTLDSNIAIPKMILFEPEPRKQYLTDYNTSWTNNQWQLKLSKAIAPFTSWQIKPIPDKIPSRSKLQEDRQTIITWVKADTSYPTSIAWEILINDTILDTVTVSTIEKKETVQQTSRSFGNTGSMQQAITAGTKEEILVAQNDTARISLSYPILSIDVGLVQLGDTSIMDTNLMVTVGADSQSLNINSALPPGIYTLKIPPNALEAYTGITKDTLVYILKIIDPKNLGTLTLNISFPADNQYVMSIYNEKNQRRYFEICHPDSLKKQIILEHIFSGKYTMNIIEDLDENGLLTKGSYYDKRQPEQQFQSQPIDLKAGWEQESSIIVTFE